MISNFFHGSRSIRICTFVLGFAFLFCCNRTVVAVSISSFTYDQSKPVTLKPLTNTLSDTTDTTGAPIGYAGKVSFDSRLKNISNDSFEDIILRVMSTTPTGIYFVNADTPGGTDLTLSLVGNYGDGVLMPGEYADLHTVFAVTDLAYPWSIELSVHGTKRILDSQLPGPHQHLASTTITFNQPVPEPATVALLGIGIVGLAGAEVRRRRKKQAIDNS